MLAIIRCIMLCLPGFYPKIKDYDVQINNFACYCVWVRNLLLTLRVECKLRVFENRALRRTFGHKRDEVTGEWRKLHNEELNYLYSSPNIFWVIKLSRMRWAELVAHMGERRGMYRVLVGKPEGKRPLGKSRHRWEDNIKMESGMWGYGLDRAASG